MVRTAISVFVFLLWCAPVVPAQGGGKPGPAYKLLTVHVKGLTHLSEAAVVRAAGLRAGQMARDEDFKQALQKLGETGLFSNLAYSYQYSNAGCNLEFQAVETEGFVPLEFDNFVWFSDQDLLDQLRTRVPLFEGQLPLSGNMPDQISQALSAMLAERTIPGQVEYLESGSIGGPISSYTYKVTFHSVVIRNADFPGAAPAEIPALQAAVKQIGGKDYLRSAMSAQEKFNLLPVYRSRGYLKAAFSESRATVVQDGAQTRVDVSFPVTPGIQYKLSSLDFGGNHAFPVDAIRSLIHMKPGEPANAVQLEEDIGAIQKLYRTTGYLEAQVRSEPMMDDASAAVHYRLAVAEGDQYHMGDLKIDGLPGDAASRLIAQWKMKKGDPFDDSYLVRFFKVMYADAQLGRSYNVIPKQSVDAQSKTADIYLHFVPKN